jgi:autonomous glycyl radical cofactor GrcA
MKWLKDWWTGACLARKVRRTSRRQSRLEHDYVHAVDDLRRIEERLLAVGVELEEQVEGSKQLMVRMKEGLDEERAKLRVAEKTVEALVAANKVLTDRWDAESAIQTRLRTASSYVEDQ